jgi:hypothetical protein
MKKKTAQLEREIASVLGETKERRRITDGQIRELIASLDGFHGNELKDRSESSVKQEIATIRYWIENAFR